MRAERAQTDIFAPAIIPNGNGDQLHHYGRSGSVHAARSRVSGIANAFYVY